MKTPIYLDNHATTPVDSRVVEAMLPYFTERYGNPASTHPFGWEAEASIQVASEKVASLIGASPQEILWTSGTTESINLALVGAAKASKERHHLITCVTEHRAVLETMRFLEGQGFRVTTLPVDSYGCVDTDVLQQSIEDKTLLISLMAANNEIGTIHGLMDIGKVAKERGVLFHVDGAQAVGRFSIDVEAMGIDLLSLSAHKVYGPKGVGALYIRQRNPHVQLKPVLYGGSHQKGLRPGTLPVPSIVGMGRAFEIAGQEMGAESRRILGLRTRLFEGIQGSVPDTFLNGHPTERLAGNLNLSFTGTTAGDVLGRLHDVAVSSGSACTSGSLEPSYVIRALGVGDERAKSSIRFGIGRFNTEEEIDYTVGRIEEVVKGLR